MNTKRVILVALALFLVLISFNLVHAQDSAEIPYLGIRFTEDESGVRVTYVAPDSPADESGIERGDIISAVNGQIIEADDLADTLHSFDVGEDIELSIVRDGETLDLEITLTEAPKSVSDLPFLPIDSLVFMQQGDSQEWQIRSLTADNPLYEAGLRAGDTITLINGETYDPASLREFLSETDKTTVTVSVERDGETLEIDVPADALHALTQAQARLDLWDDRGGWLPFDGLFDFEPLRLFELENYMRSQLQEILERNSALFNFRFSRPRNAWDA